jgi:phosphomannomutase
MSGHIFFKERWFGFDDGTYAGARLLEIVSSRPDDPGAMLDSVAHQLFDARAQRAVRRGRAAPGHRRLAERGRGAGRSRHGARDATRR